MAIEGKIPASGPISFGAVRGLLGENDPNYPCYVEPKITAFFQKYLLRIPDEGGILYYQSQLQTGNRTIDQIEQDIANSSEAQVVALIGVPIGVVGDAQDYNMNRDMFRVITKSNANQPIKASDLRIKDNSYKSFDNLVDVFNGSPSGFVESRGEVRAPISNKLFLSDYFGGDQFTDGDTIKVTTWSHIKNPSTPGAYVGFGTSYRSVVDHFIQVGTLYPELAYRADQFFIRNHAPSGRHTSHMLYYDPADQSLQVESRWDGGSAGNKRTWNSIIRIEYIPYGIPHVFYQYYDDGITNYVARYD
jgi:hypothetical protein